MARALVAALLYVAAFLFLYGAFDMAPDMRWPATSIEYTAACAMVLGSVLKMLGHVVVMGYSKRGNY